MARINDNFLKLPGSYLFSEIQKRTGAFLAKNPGAELLYLGVGDVSEPLPPTVIRALRDAVDEMGTKQGFHGYGPEYGYPFLFDPISENEYRALGIDIGSDEIVICDGAKSDAGNIQEIFSADSVIAVTDPVYPVYVDSNVMAGRTGVFSGGRWSELIYLPMVRENDYTPQLPEKRPDLIYLCSPNNPTGAAMKKRDLKIWVDYALENDAVILYDAAYKAFISSDACHSIYEVEGARRCAIEFGSFSKTAGFTGTRCSWTVVPKDILGKDASGDAVPLLDLWRRRQATKFNGTPYIVQKAAMAIYTEQGKNEVKALVSHYMANARRIRETMDALGVRCSGGVDAPYIWFPVPGGNSWAFFDRLLGECQVVGTPGAGFGPSGEGYFRLTAFGTPEATREACARIQKVL